MYNNTIIWFHNYITMIFFFVNFFFVNFRLLLKKINIKLALFFRNNYRIYSSNKTLPFPKSEIYFFPSIKYIFIGEIPAAGLLVVR